MAWFASIAILAFDFDGLRFLNLERDVLASYCYADLYRWGGSTSDISMVMWNSATQDTIELSFHTTQVRYYCCTVWFFVLVCGTSESLHASLRRASLRLSLPPNLPPSLSSPSHP
jgi:hypothetical protein